MNNQTRSFAKYASLSVIGMIGLSCYILADTFFVAQGLGTNGLAALNLAIPIYSAITGTGMMTGMGAATCYSIMRSRGDEKADKVFTNALFIAAFFTLIFEICGIFFSGSISRLLGAEGDTYEMCRVYLRTLLIFSPFFLLNNISDQQEQAAAQQIRNHEGCQSRYEYHCDAADDTREAQRENNA